MKWAYRALLGVYPMDYRIWFAGEMLQAFESAWAERRRGTLRFAAAELAGLAAGAAAEWIAKLTTDPAVRGRSLPDGRLTRPAGMPRELWFAAPPPGPPRPC